MTYEYDCIFDTGKNATTELIQKVLISYGLQQQLNNFILVGEELRGGAYKKSCKKIGRYT